MLDSTIDKGRSGAVSWRGLYRYYVLFMVIIVGACSWTDRQLFSILLESLKHSLQLTDAQLGLLGGSAFALFYVAISLPIAWLADRTNRSHIIAVSLGLWSAATALTGLAGSYMSMFWCRMGVGIGEAGASAPSQALISDYFPSARRSFAMGMLYSYMPLGYLASYSLGGWLDGSKGWRVAFLLFGVFGVLVAPLFWITVKESHPSRALLGFRSLSTRESEPFLKPLRYFLTRRSLILVPIGGALHATGMMALSVWGPAYFMRSYNMTSAAVGFRLALIMGIAGLAGTLLGGQLVDRLVAITKDARWYLWSCALFLAGSIPFLFGVFGGHDASSAFLLFIVPTILNNMLLGPVFAVIQNLGGSRRQAMAAAFYLLVVNLISSGAGPLIAGIFSDALGSRYGKSSLGISLLIVCSCASALAAILFTTAARFVRDDIAAAQSLEVV